MRSKCKNCKEYMDSSVGCDYDQINIGGQWYRRLVKSGLGSCNDCGAEKGNFHHYTCDQEICPKCQGQLISCDCKVMNVKRSE
jgi:hypothetical protein